MSDLWDQLDRKYVIEGIKGISNEEDVVDYICELLKKLESSELSHIQSSLSTGDIRSASLCYEAMGAYQLLRNKISGEEESDGTS